ncbi:MAG: MMPL family transporter, partial [Spirochaetales bacterium]|nr:MMPL family transporter [Spirochaetales bacterium]
MLKKLNRLVTSHPVITIVITLVLTGLFFYGLTKVRIVTDVGKMLPEENPKIIAFNEVDETFGGAEFIMVALESGNIFTYDVLSDIDYLTNELEKIKGISSIRSIINVEEIKGVEDGIEVVDLIEEIPSSEEGLKQLRNRILSDEEYAGNIVSKDGKVAAIVIQLQANANKSQVVHKIDEVIQNADLEEKIYFMGTPIMEDYIRSNIRDDMKRLIPIVIFVVVIVLFLSFQNLLGILLPLIIVMISTVWAIGLMGFLKIPLSNVSNIMPVILISVGSAYGIHILAHYQEELASGSSKKEAIEKTISTVGLAVVLAGITTVIGFAANSFSPLRPIREFGIFTAFGVGVAFFISITFIPAILFLLRTSRSKTFSKRGKNALLVSLLKKVAILTTKSPKVVLIVTVIVGLLALAFIPRLSTEFDLMSFFKPNSPQRIAFNLAKEKFGGSDSIQVAVKRDIQEPDVLKSMEQFQDEIKETGILSRPYSIVNVLKDVNEALHEGDPHYKILPSSSEEVAQYLLLLSLGGAEELDRIISFGYDQALIQARVAIIGSSSEEKERMIKNVEESIERNFNNENTKVVLTGMPVLEQEMINLLVKGQLQSLAVAVLFVLILMVIVTRSFIYGTFCT